MVKQGVQGRIIFTGSALAYFSFVGYSSYSPGKYALRGMFTAMLLVAPDSNHCFLIDPSGLADCLRNEMLLYGITIQMYFPNTMLTPGYEDELKIRPAITAKIEEGDEPVSAEHAAKVMVDGAYYACNLTHLAQCVIHLFRSEGRTCPDFRRYPYIVIPSFNTWDNTPGQFLEGRCA